MKKLMKMMMKMMMKMTMTKHMTMAKMTMMTTACLAMQCRRVMPGFPVAIARARMHGNDVALDSARHPSLSATLLG